MSRAEPRPHSTIPANAFPEFPGLTPDRLEAELMALGTFPRDSAPVAQLCVRPGPDLRETRSELVLDPALGAIGDRWVRGTWMHLPDGRPDPRVQVAVGNHAILSLVQRLTGNLQHPGDTLLTTLDLSEDNLPAGARLRVGTAVIEVSDVENDACAKFASRHGGTVFAWIRDPANRRRRLRGLFARVLVTGIVRIGDTVEVLR